MNDRGFTLAEVMVALMVFSTAAIGLAHLVNETTANARHTRSLALAAIEADNRLVEAVADPAVLRAGSMSGQSEQRGQSFEWVRQIEVREPEGLAGVRVTVSDASTGQQLATRDTLVRVAP
ncbi:type II secretion system minor pseudopilin GspI [Hyphomonas sp.]|jgi:general secretion pathway protein I|uniref:type II secretion system minor pseudopilin GspI n=1 Tax=Hyphomonas sp. TaxID=87 RepID=UPI000C660383|nr:type II secretion system minor pseudopilin GspI [Hyphomonas sp.]MAB12123.1 type II secretion system protein GspI [Hyphomonas sp.]MAU67058.1 type II secretion system protein GspI [Hyphomonas sp.]